MVEVEAKELQYATHLVNGLQDKVHLVGVIKPEIHLEKHKIRQIKRKYQTTSVNCVVLSLVTGVFVLHVKQHVIIAMPWDIINQSAAKGPKKYIMYKTVHLHKAMYQSSVIPLISLDILQKTWVEFLP